MNQKIYETCHTGCFGIQFDARFLIFTMKTYHIKCSVEIQLCVVINDSRFQITFTVAWW